MVANDAGWLFNFEQDQYRPAAPVLAIAEKSWLFRFYRALGGLVWFC
jgi:hypothetical protein